MTTERPNVSPTGRYSIRQAAAALGVCESTVRNYVKSGEFHTYELSRKRVGSKCTIIRGSAIVRVWAANL